VQIDYYSRHCASWSKGGNIANLHPICRFDLMRVIPFRWRPQKDCTVVLPKVAVIIRDVNEGIESKRFYYYYFVLVYSYGIQNMAIDGDWF
jgi:hypothetical protein